MGIGPAFSNLIALKRAGLALKDLDVIECNEAFAAQNLSVIKEMESQTGISIDQSKWNPNGGAIAFGHPNGASGARICLFAMKDLERTGGRYGLFSSCCGGGHGVTTLLEKDVYKRQVIGSHGGLSVGEDGATHQCIEDYAIMRAIPGMMVVSPCDGPEMRLAVKALLEYKGCLLYTSGFSTPARSSRSVPR